MVDHKKARDIAELWESQYRHARAAHPRDKMYALAEAYLNLARQQEENQRCLKHLIKITSPNVEKIIDEIEEMIAEDKDVALGS